MKVSVRSLVVIPARAGSTRFPNKVIAPLHGKPLMQYTWEIARKSPLVDKVLIATDDEAIKKVGESFGAEVVMTPGTLASGSDRVAFVAKDFAADIVVNLQADEPLLPPHAVGHLIKELLDKPSLDMATLAVRKDCQKDCDGAFKDPNVVKVVLSRDHRALFFSRQPITQLQGAFYKHIGVYVFRHAALQRFCKLSPSSLEVAERLEQLRALENNMSISVVLIHQDTTAVDVPSDIGKVEKILEQGFLSTDTLDTLFTDTLLMGKEVLS